MIFKLAATIASHRPPSTPARTGWPTRSRVLPRGRDHGRTLADGPCGTIPEGTNFGSEFGWPSADIMTVSDTVTPPGENVLRAATGASDFLDYRSQIKNPDYTVETMLYANSTMTAMFPTLIVHGTFDITSDSLCRVFRLPAAAHTSHGLYWYRMLIGARNLSICQSVNLSICQSVNLCPICVFRPGTMPRCKGWSGGST